MCGLSLGIVVHNSIILPDFAYLMVAKGSRTFLSAYHQVDVAVNCILCVADINSRFPGVVYKGL